MNERDEALRARIRSARALPSPPAVTAQLIHLCEDPDAGILDVLDVLNTDPALAARLMRLANSPMYARRRRTENLRQAVTLLGFDAVLTASLSLTLAARRSTSDHRSARFRTRRWARSVYSAACAQLLADQMPEVDSSDAFLVGLLADIGVQVVDRLEPETYDRCDPHGTHGDLVAAEREALGADHAELGSVLLEAWRLPPSIVDAVRFSHDPNHADASPMAAIAATAGFIADGFGGEGAGFDRALAIAERNLTMSTSAFANVLERMAVVLPDVGSILNADVPDQETLAELAEEAILMRQLHVQSTTAELHDEVESLRTVAAELRNENGLDPLTGLSNRRRLDEVLDLEFAAAARNGFPLSILFIDFDDFKLVNDRYGHRIGDDVLAQSARRISTALRDGDVVARFGGEEFVVVLPGTDRFASSNVAGRVIDSFIDQPFEIGDDIRLQQTVSIGVATLDEHSVIESVGDLLHAADLALYSAKRNGKRQYRRSDEKLVADSSSQN